MADGVLPRRMLPSSAAYIPLADGVPARQAIKRAKAFFAFALFRLSLNRQFRLSIKWQMPLDRGLQIALAPMARPALRVWKVKGRGP
jgi:hypothetical protein